MDLHTVIDIVTILASLATIWVVISSKTIPDLAKELANHQGFDLAIIGILVLIAASISWLILRSSSPETQLAWYEVIVIGLVASVVGLLLTQTSPWSLLTEVILGPLGAVGGIWLADSFIHIPSFSASISIAFASALALITFFRLFEYFIKRDAHRFTIGIFFLIIAAVGWWGVYSSSLNSSFAWYHLLLIDLVVSAISLVIPKAYFFSILTEVAIGPIGAFGGYYLITVFINSHNFNRNVGIHNVGIVFLIAFGLMFILRLAYFQFFSKPRLGTF